MADTQIRPYVIDGIVVAMASRWGSWRADTPIRPYIIGDDVYIDVRHGR